MSQYSGFSYTVLYCTCKQIVGSASLQGPYCLTSFDVSQSMVIRLQFDKHSGKWYKMQNEAEKMDDPEKNPNEPHHHAGRIGGPRFDDSFREAEAVNGYWDPDRKDFVVLEPCIVKTKHVNKGQTNEKLYYMVEFDKPHFGKRCILYNQRLEGPVCARRLALRHHPRQVYE